MAIIIGEPTGAAESWSITVTFTSPIPITSSGVTRRDIRRLTRAIGLDIRDTRIGPDIRGTRLIGPDLPATVLVIPQVTPLAILRALCHTRASLTLQQRVP